MENFWCQEGAYSTPSLQHIQSIYSRTFWAEILALPKVVICQIEVVGDLLFYSRDRADSPGQCYLNIYKSKEEFWNQYEFWSEANVEILKLELYDSLVHIEWVLQLVPLCFELAEVSLVCTLGHHRATSCNSQVSMWPENELIVQRRIGEWVDVWH